jgi:hypothetical protein
MAAAVATRNDFDNNDEVEGPVSSFQSMAAEGDILAKMADYRKAVEAYTKVIQ